MTISNPSPVSELEVEDLRRLLLFVGVDPSVDVESTSESLEQLGLDSLASLEITTRIKQRFGLVLDEQELQGLRPSELRERVNVLLAGM